MMMPGEREVFKCGKLLEVFQELEAFVHASAQEGQAAHEVELGVWTKILEIGHYALGQFFALQGTGDMGPTIVLPTGEEYRRLDQLHPRRYVTVLGQFDLLRTVYGTREGQKIEFVPLDNRLQLPAGVFSYLLQDWDQALCVEESFDQAQTTVKRILGLKQSVNSLETMNAAMAKDVGNFREDRPMPAPETEGAIVVASADGKGIVMRREQSPDGLAPDQAEKPQNSQETTAHRTKGQKANQKKMAIVGTVYTVNRYVRTPEEVLAALFRERRQEPSERPQPQNKHVWASLERTDAEGVHSGIDLVYPWMLNELAERNPRMAKETVYLHDGQEALWEARTAHLPRKNGTDILDLLHVTPRLWKAAHLFHSEKSPAVEEMVRDLTLRVLQGRVDGVIRGLREMATKRGLKGSKKAQMTKICGYLKNNRERMHYDEYLAKGYPIATGVVEGACRHLIKDRMERAGMHWRPGGGQAMLDVRSTHVNGDWETYQKYRIERETIRLYPHKQLVDGDKYPLAV